MMEPHDDGSLYSTHAHGKQKGRPAAGSQAQVEKLRLMSDMLSTKQLADQDSRPSSSSTSTSSSSRPYPFDRPEPKQQAPPIPAAWQELKRAAKEAEPAALAQARAQRDKEARLLRDMFQAVWPDLGSFKSWAGATRVASMSGSLTLSVAFFGFVYYVSSRYDKASGGPASHTTSSSNDRA